MNSLFDLSNNDWKFSNGRRSWYDDRYFGSDPKGSKGGGYGDMRGAKPLTESW